MVMTFAMMQRVTPVSFASIMFYKVIDYESCSSGSMMAVTSTITQRHSCFICCYCTRFVRKVSDRVTMLVILTMAGFCVDSPRMFCEVIGHRSCSISEEIHLPLIQLLRNLDLWSFPNPKWCGNFLFLFLIKKLISKKSISQDIKARLIFPWPSFLGKFHHGPEDYSGLLIMVTLITVP